MTTIDPLSIRRHRWTVKELQRFVEHGAFLPEDRIELIAGELIDMAPIGPEHAGVVDLLMDNLNQRVKQKLLIRGQNPIILGDHSAPQPDVALVHRHNDFYRSHHPHPEDIVLLIEVADTTVHYDRTVKIPLYTRYNIPEVWLIDLSKRCIEVYREPTETGYQTIEHHHQGKIVCASLPDAWLRVEEFTF